MMTVRKSMHTPSIFYVQPWNSCFHLSDLSCVAIKPSKIIDLHLTLFIHWFTHQFFLKTCMLKLNFRMMHSMYFSKVTPLKTNIFLLKIDGSGRWTSSPKRWSLFSKTFRQFFGGEGSSITSPAPPKKIPSPLRLMYALRRLSRQQWACSLVSYQIHPSTLRHVGLPERNTSRGFDEVWVDPGGYPTYYRKQWILPMKRLTFC